MVVIQIKLACIVRQFAITSSASCFKTFFLKSVFGQALPTSKLWSSSIFDQRSNTGLPAFLIHLVLYLQIFMHFQHFYAFLVISKQLTLLNIFSPMGGGGGQPD